MAGRPRIYGHRGASAAAPENTLDAFSLALDMGADGVELDVRRSLDGALVLHHDAVLADGRVIAETLRADLPASIPTLADALDVCVGAVVNIEIKNIPHEPDFDPACTIVESVVAVLAERSDRDEVIVSSFHLATIDRVKALSPRTRTGFLTFLEPAAEEGVTLAAARRHEAVHPHHGFVAEPLVAAAVSAGLQLNTWTVDDPDLMRTLAALGVDGIVTNVPDLALAVLEG